MESEAKTALGPVLGRALEQDGRAVARFLGIPFARAPVGRLRFAPPQPPEPWTRRRPATAYGPAPPQAGGALLDLIGASPRAAQAEDCLTLNVFTPGMDGARRPVMVWIHGGAFVSGSADAAVYDGARLGARGDVVVVTFNYRVGALGWLHLDGREGAGGPRASNLGLQDQIAALRWVRDNAACFGGDPERVTLFGESAGAGSILALLAAPAARGLFHGAIVQSAAPDGYLTSGEASERTARLLALLGVAPAALPEVPLAALLDAQQKAASERFWKTGMFFTPVVDGEILPARPMAALREGEAASLPLVIGTTRDELQLYKYGREAPPIPDEAVVQAIAAALPEALEDRPGEARRIADALRRARAARAESLQGIDRIYAFQTDWAMRGPAIRLAEQRARRGARTFCYLFDWTSPAQGGALGACHALDVPFTFGALDVPGVSHFTGSGPAAGRVAAQIMDAWIQFARSGQPEDRFAGRWPTYDETRRHTVRIGTTPQVEPDPRQPERTILADLLDRTLP